MPSAQLHLQASARNVSQARHFARDRLADWQCDALAAAAELLVSELVSNAVLHARSSVNLSLVLDNQRLLIEVRDESSSSPITRHYDDHATTGRGMRLIDHLTNGDWGVRPDGTGKVVWARVAVSDDGQREQSLWVVADDDQGWDDLDAAGTQGPLALAA